MPSPPFFLSLSLSQEYMDSSFFFPTKIRIEGKNGIRGIPNWEDLGDGQAERRTRCSFEWKRLVGGGATLAPLFLDKKCFGRDYPPHTWEVGKADGQNKGKAWIYYYSRY